MKSSIITLYTAVIIFIKRFQLIASAAFCGIALLLESGCVSASKSENMMAGTMAAAPNSAGPVRVTVGGGSARISAADFAAALKASITQSGVFSKLVSADEEYDLEVQMIRLDQPTVGLSLTAVLETTWTLTDARDKRVLWQQSVKTEFTATMSDAFVAATRLRMANDGAARENIKAGLTQIEALKLR